MSVFGSLICQLLQMPLAPTDLDLSLEKFSDPEVVEDVYDLMNEAAISKEESIYKADMQNFAFTV
jgi:hypothetical protein